MRRQRRSERLLEQGEADRRRFGTWVGVVSLAGVWLLGLGLQTLLGSGSVLVYTLFSLVTLVVAAVPFVVAHQRGHDGLGNAAMLACAGIGLLLGPVFAIPVAVCFLIVALVRKRPTPPPGRGVVRVFGHGGRSRPDDLDEVGRRMAAESAPDADA